MLSKKILSSQVMCMRGGGNASDSRKFILSKGKMPMRM